MFQGTTGRAAVPYSKVVYFKWPEHGVSLYTKIKSFFAVELGTPMAVWMAEDRADEQNGCL